MRVARYLIICSLQVYLYMRRLSCHSAVNQSKIAVKCCNSKYRQTIATSYSLHTRHKRKYNFPKLQRKKMYTSATINSWRRRILKFFANYFKPDKTEKCGLLNAFKKFPSNSLLRIFCAIKSFLKDTTIFCYQLCKHYIFLSPGRFKVSSSFEIRICPYIYLISIRNIWFLTHR